MTQSNKLKVKSDASALCLNVPANRALVAISQSVMH